MTKESKHTPQNSPQITKKDNKKKQGTKDLQNSQKMVNKMAVVSPHLSIITLNINRLKSVIKRHRIAEWITKTRSNHMLSKRDSL